MQRREFLFDFAAASLPGLQSQPAAKRKGRLKQSVMRFNFPANTPFEDMCKVAARLGFDGFDLTGSQDWPVLHKYGLTPTLVGGGGATFENGLIRKELHDRFEQGIRASTDQCVTIGCPNLIVIPGQRRGMSYDEGADNCVAILNRVKGYAEDKGVTVCIEITNLKDRPDQIFNRLGWGFDVCKRVNSPRVKVVFDIYHAQITDGNVTRNIQENFALICHFHAAGVPDRNEIDETQEVNYHYIAKVIADLAYAGYVAHEYRPGPGRDPIKSLEQAYEIMTV